MQPRLAASNAGTAMARPKKVASGGSNDEWEEF
jgi:hypothetical protein